MSDEKQDYYAEGNDAAHSGQHAADCPYEFSSPEGEEWLKGFWENGGEE
jgi:hypothetical protein